MTPTRRPLIARSCALPRALPLALAFVVLALEISLAQAQGSRSPAPPTGNPVVDAVEATDTAGATRATDDADATDDTDSSSAASPAADSAADSAATSRAGAAPDSSRPSVDPAAPAAPPSEEPPSISTTPPGNPLDRPSSTQSESRQSESKQSESRQFDPGQPDLRQVDSRPSDSRPSDRSADSNSHAQRMTPSGSSAVFPPAERAPAITAVGGYGGFPSMAGLQIVAPVDARMAFRAGLTGFPGIGALWTPGFEVRFGQVPGTFNTDSAYAWTDLYWGRAVWNERDRPHHGLEAGLGYRWILPDRRGVRWIAALEAGGFWKPAHAYPVRPAIRAAWMIATP